MRFVSLGSFIATLFMTNELFFVKCLNVTSDATSRSRNTSSGSQERNAFSYRIGDALSNQYREEHRDDQGVVRGSYGFRTPLGEFRQVKYTADSSGFRAQVLSNEPGISQQNPADVQVQKISSYPLANDPKLKQVPGIYPLQNNLLRREVPEDTTDNRQSLVPGVIHHDQPSFLQRQEGDVPRYQDNHLYPDSYLNGFKNHQETPVMEVFNSAWDKQDHDFSNKNPDLQSSHIPFHKVFLVSDQHRSSTISPLSLNEDKIHISEKDFRPSVVQPSDNHNPRQNKWVLGFIPFGIRADHISEVSKRLSTDVGSPESNDSPTMFFDLKSSDISSNNPNRKNCKRTSNSGGNTNQLLNGMSKVMPSQGYEEYTSTEDDVDKQEGNQHDGADNDIYLIQSIFAKRLAGILDSGRIFPPHLLPLSNTKADNGQHHPLLRIPSSQKSNITLSESRQWASQQQNFKNQPLNKKENFDSTYSNPNSAQNWKDNSTPLGPISISLSSKTILPNQQTQNQPYIPSSEDVNIHKVGRRGEENQRYPLLLANIQEKDKASELILRNFYEGKVHSARIKHNSQQQNKAEYVDGGSISFQGNPGASNDRMRTSLNRDQHTVLNLPSWSGNQHRLFEIPRLNRPLYDSKGLPVKPEDVPIHLHRFMPPKPQYSRQDNSFSFAIPRPVPPRSVVIPPKPPLTL